MSTPLLDDDESLALKLIGALITVLLIGVVAFGVMRTPAPTGKAASAALDGARIVVLDDRVKFYFASGSATLAEGSDAALSTTVQAVNDGATAVLSGFHDATGDAAMNAELAKQRALAVQAALLRLGVTAERIELKKPESSPGTGADPEARRVEVSLR